MTAGGGYRKQHVCTTYFLITKARAVFRNFMLFNMTKINQITIFVLLVVPTLLEHWKRVGTAIICWLMIISKSVSVIFQVSIPWFLSSVSCPPDNDDIERSTPALETLVIFSQFNNVICGVRWEGFLFIFISLFSTQPKAPLRGLVVDHPSIIMPRSNHNSKT